MAIFENLPGTYVDFLDGNLSIVETNPAPVTLVLGTSEKGTAEVLTPVVRPADAVNAFGSSGTLIRGMYEARGGGATNLVLWRMAAQAAKLLFIGDDTGVAGITLETVDKDNTAGDELYVAYDDTTVTLEVYDSDEVLVFQSVANTIVTDTGVVFSYGTAVGGAGTDIGTVGAFATAVWMQSVSGGALRFTAGTDGITGSAMELYEALEKAYSELEAFDVDHMIPMDVYMDTPNIADDSTVVDSWSMPQLLSTGGETTLDLAHADVVLSSIVARLDPLGGGAAADMSFLLNRGAGVGGVDQIEFAALTATDTVDVSYQYMDDDALLYYRKWEEDGETLFEWSTTRYRAAWENSAWVSYEYSEANFAWQLANYCFNLTQNDNDCTGTIGVRPFRSTALKDIADWAGYLPEKDDDDIVTTNGAGLAGNKWMAGKLVTVPVFSEKSDDLSGLIAASAGPFALTEGDVVGASLVVIADGVQVPVASITAGAPDTFLLVDALAGTETTFDAYYTYESSSSTAQFGPGFYASVEETPVGTNLDPAVDIGRYLSVVMSWPILFTPVDNTGFGYIATGAPAYSGFVSQLAPQSAPTNKVLPSTQMPFRLSKTRMDDLVSVHYVLFTPRERGTVIVDAPTAATSASDYQRLTTVRIVNECTKRIREVLTPFIGEGMTAPQMEAMQTTTDRVMTDAIKDGLIQRFEASVTASAAERVAGKANVDMVLVPAFELRQIFITISLSAI